MKRFLTMFLGLSVVIVCCVVPSFAASSTPSYPSGNFVPYAGYVPQGTKSSSTGVKYYSAIASSLYNGFWTVNRGFYDLQKTANTMSTALTNIKSYMLGSGTNSYTAFTGIGTGLTDTISYSNRQGVLVAINQNLYYGFRTLFKGLGSLNTSIETVDKNIGTMDGHLTSGFTALGTKLDSKFTSLENNLDVNFAELLKALLGSEMTFDFQVDLSKLEGGLSELNGTVSGGFPMINRWFQVFYNLLFDPLDEELKDASAGQKQELLDKFYGEGGNGLQDGQIGSMGDISSSAGSLLDSGGDVGNVFSEIGNSGSSVWSWFSTENADNINGAGGRSLLSDDEFEASPTPSLDIVDFYSIQHEELLSLLGGE